MTSGIQSQNNVQAAPALNAHAPGANASAPIEHSKPVVKIPSRPVIIAPKAVDIDYDPNEVRQSLNSAIKLLNDQVATKSQGLGFSFDHSIKNPVIVVRNLETGQVVRQIPNEDVLRMAHKLDELKGLLFNKKA
jgi:uncharacterized FlaG/YvyC family protein